MGDGAAGSRDRHARVPSEMDDVASVTADNLYERFVRLFAGHEPTVRAFVRAGLPSPHDVDDVMQEVGIVAWRKFGELDDPDLFPRWLCLIAKYEILKHRRSKARDRLVLSEEVVQLLLDEGAEEADLRLRQRRALEQCLQKLPSGRRELVLWAYAPEQSIAQVATQLGKTAAAVYQLLSRIRRILHDCVERVLAAEAREC